MGRQFRITETLVRGSADLLVLEVCGFFPGSTGFWSLGRLFPPFHRTPRTRKNEGTNRGSVLESTKRWSRVAQTSGFEVCGFSPGSTGLWSLGRLFPPFHRTPRTRKNEGTNRGSVLESTKGWSRVAQTSWFWKSAALFPAAADPGWAGGATRSAISGRRRVPAARIPPRAREIAFGIRPVTYHSRLY